MTILQIFDESGNAISDPINEITDIQSTLTNNGVLFERWQAEQDLPAGAEQEMVLSAYQADILKLSDKYKISSTDVVSLTPDHPNKMEFRQKFLAEHIHEDFEIRFFVDGSGLFYLHIEDKVYLVLCEKGDLISVPANTTHWFDMGENPAFTCIRLFTTDNGWVANFTGDDIATRLPSMDTFVTSVMAEG